MGMNKVSKPILPAGESDYDRRLNQVLDRFTTAVSDAVGQAADGYLYYTTSVAANYTMTLNDTIILVDATGGNKTITLKPVDQCKHKRLVVKKIDTSGNTVTIDANSTEVIDNAATYVISTAYAAVDLVSDGAKWWIV